MCVINCSTKNTKHIGFTICANDNEQYVTERLYKEKPLGTVERLDSRHYKFISDKYDINEMITWIRTFISRITELDFPDKDAESRFYEDIEIMYEMYEIGGEQL